MRITLAVLSLALAAGSAQAAIITTGTISGLAGDSSTVSLPMYTVPGQYRSYISFSDPGSFTLAYNVQRSTNLFCDFHDGQGYVACGGDDIPVGFDVSAGPGALDAMLNYSLQPLTKVIYSPDQYGMVFDQAIDANFVFNFEQDGTVSYRVVTAPVPEPEHWVLMLVGFAMGGAMLRLQWRKAALA